MRFHHYTMFVCCGLALHCCVCLLWGDTTLLCLFAVNFSTLLSLFAMRWHHFVVFFAVRWHIATFVFCEVVRLFGTLLCFLVKKWNNITLLCLFVTTWLHVAEFVCLSMAPRCSERAWWRTLRSNHGVDKKGTRTNVLTLGYLWFILCTFY